MRVGLVDVVVGWLIVVSVFRVSPLLRSQIGISDVDDSSSSAFLITTLKAEGKLIRFDVFWLIVVLNRTDLKSLRKSVNKEETNHVFSEPVFVPKPEACILHYSHSTRLLFLMLRDEEHVLMRHCVEIFCIVHLLQSFLNLYVRLERLHFEGSMLDLLNNVSDQEYLFVSLRAPPCG